MPTVTITTENRLEAEQMIRAPEAWGALFDLAWGNLHRELTKREHEFKTAEEALDWVEKEIEIILEDIPVEDMNRNDSGL